jgi:hypothetical protein
MPQGQFLKAAETLDSSLFFACLLKLCASCVQLFVVCMITVVYMYICM